MRGQAINHSLNTIECLKVILISKMHLWLLYLMTELSLTSCVQIFIETVMAVLRTYERTNSEYVMAKSASLEAKCWQNGRSSRREIERTVRLLNRLKCRSNCGHASTAEKVYCINCFILS